MKKKINITKIENTISVYEGRVPISSSLHEEYIAYHEKINFYKYDYKETIKHSKELFDKTTSDEIVKKLLFLLGELATPESFQILKKYIDNDISSHKEWALLALQELRFHVENDVYDEGKDMIMSPVGGKGDMLRYYVVLSKKQNKQFTDLDKKIIIQELTKVAKGMKSEVEELEFDKSYVLITMLTSIDVASGSVLDAFLDICSIEKGILRYHYYATNTHKPTKEEIEKEYLSMENVQKL